MFSLLLQIDEEDQDPVVAELWERRTTGIVQRYETLEAFFDDESQAPALVLDFSAYAPVIQRHDDTDWARRTEDSFPAQLVGERFFLVPPWNSAPTPSGRLRLVLNPGLACGTGWHPCTRMCLEAMEQFVRPGARVLDVGVGSGILSAAAQLLGADFVAGCDVDADAVQVARERVDASLFVGSADAVRSAAFDVVVANISADAVWTLWPDLDRIGRTVILSGFQDAPALPRDPVQKLDRDGWLCLVV